MASFTPGPSGAVALPQPAGGEPPPYSAAIEAGAISVERFVPGRSDDDAALADAIAYANGRPIMLAGRVYQIGFPKTGRLIGQGHGSTTVRALTANAGLNFGAPQGQAPVQAGGGGYLTYDGAAIDTNGVVVNTAGGLYSDLWAVGVNGDNLRVIGQNNSLMHPGAGVGTNGLVFDEGAGGNRVYGPYTNLCSGANILFKQSHAFQYGYAIPTLNTIFDPLVENNPSAAGVRHEAGANNSICGYNIAQGVGGGPCVLFTPAAQQFAGYGNGAFSFVGRGAFLNDGAHPGVRTDANAGTGDRLVTFYDEVFFSGCAPDISSATGYPVQFCNAQVFHYGAGARYAASGAGTIAPSEVGNHNRRHRLDWAATVDGGSAGWIVADNAAMHGLSSMQADGVQNRSLLWNVNIAPGVYRIDIYTQTQNNLGIYHVLIDGIDIAQLDAYSAGSVANVDLIQSNVPITWPGTHQVQVVMSTKNAASTGYGAILYALLFTRTA